MVSDGRRRSLAFGESLSLARADFVIDIGEIKLSLSVYTALYKRALEVQDFESRVTENQHDYTLPEPYIEVLSTGWVIHTLQS